MSSTQIELVCFDLDDTLWSTRQVMFDAEKSVYALLQDLSPVLTDSYELESLFKARMEFWKRTLQNEPEMRHQIGTMRRRSLAHLLRQSGYSDEKSNDISEKAFEHFMEMRHQPIYFDDAIETLETLAKDYQLAAISNGNACSTRLGLDKYFGLHISAEELGVGKPEPEPFSAALAHFDLKPEQCVHIGDNPTDDILGARQSGFHSIWFNPENTPWEETQFQPSIEIHRLKDIPTAVRKQWP